MSKLKDKIINSKHDELLHRIQNLAIGVMSLCVLTFFLVQKFLRPYLIIHIAIFCIALAIVLIIGVFWFLKSFLPYRDMALQQFYAENPDCDPNYRKGKLNEKKNNKSED